ncbi:MAG: DUF4123 domain-containing protein, partial [Pseudomonadales bacterium]|nr:DUF4123 domain-containing protein [Pseudomonadales bacterium]
DSELLTQYFLRDDEPEYRPLFLGANEELLSISPYLLEIKASTEPFIDWYQHHSEQWGFFFNSHLNLQAQLGYWQSLLEVITPNNNSTAWFRYYDGKVLERFLQTASKADINRFFQPCNSLVFQENDLQWQRLNITHDEDSIQINEQPSVAIPEAPWFQLSPPSFQALLPDAKQTLQQDILQIAWHCYPEKLEKEPAGKIDHLLEAGINNAESLGIDSARHIALFVCLTIEFHPKFYLHPRFQTLYKAENNLMSRSLDRMQREFTTSDWQALSNHQYD